MGLGNSHDYVSEVAEIVEVAQDAVDPAEVAAGQIYIVRDSNGARVVDLTGHPSLPEPSRRTGTSYVDDVASFGWLFGRSQHAERTEVYASRERCNLTAVFNAHSAGADGVAGYGDHRLVLQLQHTESWADWYRISGKPCDQKGFAEFIEDHLDDINEPAAAAMLEIVQTLQGTLKVQWQSATVLRDGTRKLAYVESMDATAGGAGELKIPGQIKLGLRVFEGTSDRYEVTGRFRYEMRNGQLSMTVKLDHLDRTRDAALDAVVIEVGALTGATVLWGRPS